MGILLNDGLSENLSAINNKLSKEEKEKIRVLQVTRNNYYIYIARIN